MRALTKGLVSIALVAAACSMGCGSSSGTGTTGAAGTSGAAGTGSFAGVDGSATGTAGSDGSVCSGVTLYALTTGDSCFDIVSVTAGANDGCMLGVADPVAMMGLVGSTLPVNYDMPTATLTVGTMGSLGAGPIMCNMGTLTRNNNPSLSSAPTCTWNQTDTSMVNVTNTNEFDISVTEVEQTFAAACPSTDVPTGGQCMSTWTWHMVKSTDTTKVPPTCM
jgi:hypothetical protein